MAGLDTHPGQDSAITGDAAPPFPLAAQRGGLREFQARLAERLRSAEQGTVASLLGFVAGGQYWLTALDDLDEVVSAPQITPIPWARPWFIGLASVRGMLYACTDLAAFLGYDPEVSRGEGKLLLVHPRFGINAGLRIERTVGLRNPAELQPVSQTVEDTPWVCRRWRDAEGRQWSELDIPRLLQAPVFLDIAAERTPQDARRHAP